MASFGAALTLRSLLEFIFTSKPAYYTQALQIALPLGGGLRATPDQLLSLGVAAVLVVAVHLLLTRTAIGRSMRAVSENPQLAGVVGIEVRQVIRVVWLLGAGLACVAGVSAGLLVQIRPQMGLDLLLPLFAAAILGGIGSVPGAMLAGLIVGLTEALAVQLIGAEWRAAVAFVILVAGAAACARRACSGGPNERRADRLRAAFFLTMALTYAIICLGLNVQWGQTGLFNVGVAGFVAIGAYVSALLTTPDAADRFGGFDLPIAVGWLGGALAAGLVSFLIGALTIRLRADYLAIATFGVAVDRAARARSTSSRSPAGRSASASSRGPSPGWPAIRCCSACSISACSAIGRRRALSRARAAGAQPVGPRAARDPRGRGGGAGARQERDDVPAAGLCHRRRHHGPGRRRAGAFHRLHRAGQLSCRC